MKVAVTGIGIWARGLTNLAEFAEAQQSGFAALDQAVFEPPRPAAIPARERRRAGLAINLCVEVAHQACAVAGIDKSSVPSVFVSALGDTAITDYMCRKLAGADKLLSPTKFHNSVHNAPACYWAISANNRAPNTFIGGFVDSFGVGFFEAASQAIGTKVGAALLVGYDIVTSPPLNDVAPITETLAVAFVITSPSQASFPNALLPIEATLRFTARSSPSSKPIAPALVRFSETNPMGCALTLIEHCVTGLAGSTVRLSAGPQAHLELCFEAAS